MEYAKNNPYLMLLTHNKRQILDTNTRGYPYYLLQITPTYTSIWSGCPVSYHLISPRIITLTLHPDYRLQITDYRIGE